VPVIVGVALGGAFGASARLRARPLHRTAHGVRLSVVDVCDQRDGLLGDRRRDRDAGRPPPPAGVIRVGLVVGVSAATRRSRPFRRKIFSLLESSDVGVALRRYDPRQASRRCPRRVRGDAARPFALERPTVPPVFGSGTLHARESRNHRDVSTSCAVMDVVLEPGRSVGARIQPGERSGHGRGERRS